MKLLAIGRIRAGTRDVLAGRPGAVLILEADSAKETASALSRLPLVQMLFSSTDHS